MKKVKEFLNRINWKEIPPATYARYILMMVSIINTILTRCGINPIQVSETELYQFISDVLTIAILISNTWCNNSVTQEAIAADHYLKELKTGTCATTTEE